MNTRKIPSFTIVSVAAGLLLLLSPGLSAQANSASLVAEPTQVVGRSGVPDISEGELDDIALLSESLNISMAEGLRLYGQQEDFLISLAETEVAEKGNFSAAGYETSGSARGWISFVSPPKASTVRSLSLLPMQVDLRSGSAFSAEAADAALTRVVERISASGATDRFNAWVEPVSGNLTVEFKATNLAADGLTRASVSKVIKSLWASLPYSVEANPDFQGTAPAVAHGGDWISSLGCTAGFTVLKGGVPGISTAGHCGNAAFTYGGYVAGFQQQIWGSGGDAQWSSFAGQSSSAILNTIRLSSSASTTYRYILGTANPVAGAGVCYYGESTGHHCTTVSNAGPLCKMDTQNNLQTCNLFELSAHTAAPGDSGGPVFWNNRAMGLTQGINPFNDYAAKLSSLTAMNVFVKIT